MTKMPGEHRHLAAGGAARPELWHAGPRESEILFSVHQLGPGDIVGRFERWKATFVVDLEQPRRCSIDVIIEAASLETGESARDAYARSEAFLDVIHFPEIRFCSSDIDPEDDSRRLTITGNLTIRDVTREVQVAVEHEGPQGLLAGSSKVAFRGEVSIRRLDFGLRWQDELEEGRLVAGGVVDVDLQVTARRGAK